MLNEGVYRQVKTTYDSLGHTLLVPGMRLELEIGDTDLEFGDCDMCGCEVQVYGPNHPQYKRCMPLDQGKYATKGWECCICMQTFLASDKLYCCDTWAECQWQACEGCQNREFGRAQVLSHIADARQLESMMGGKASEQKSIHLMSRK